MPPAIQAILPEIEVGLAEPFLKWAGGKSQLLAQLGPFFPQKFNDYYEPFAGSAAVFFYLRRKHRRFPAILVDTNAELINCYNVVKDTVRELIPLLRRHQAHHEEDYYYELRDCPPQNLTEVKRAARFIYLNKTCYNGLYRVNSRGQFNVPVGSYKRPNIFDQENLQAVSVTLKHTKLLAADFSVVLDFARRGDFIYFDPPYYTESKGFTGYAVSPSGRAEFNAFEHRMLFNVVRELHKRGCYVVVSNSDTTYIRRLFRSFRQHVVKARRFINCEGEGRHPVSELVITNR